MTDAAAAARLPACPRCGAGLPSLSGPHRPGADVVRCPGCGQQLPLDALLELQQLTSWGEWMRQRAAWLHDRLATGDLPAQGWSARAASPPGAVPGSGDTAGGGIAPGIPLPAPPPTGLPTGPTSPPKPSAGAGGVLLGGGAVLLVLAGIAFIGFAWDLLGPAGQLVTLYAIAVLAVLAGLRLHPRLPGTGTTLAVVGVLLVAVSTVATRVLAPDLVGETAAVALGTIAAVLLAAAGVRLLPRLRPVGELAAVVGAALALGIVALAPLPDDAVPVGERWAWWPGLVLLLGGALLLSLGHRLAVRSWPPLATGALFVGSLVLAGQVADRLDSAGNNTQVVWFGGVVTLLALAAAQLLLVRVLPWRPHAPAWSTGASLVVAWAAAFVAGVTEPASRPLAAVAFALVAGVLLLLALVVPAGPVVTAAHVLALAAVGGAVGFGLAPWTTGWTDGRGVVAGLVIGLLLVAVAELDRRDLPGLIGIPALVAGAAALGCWVLAVTGDLPWVTGQTRLDVAAALALVALAGWAEAARRRLPSWSVWLSAAPASAAVAVALAELAVGAEPDPAWLPEAYGVGLAATAAVAGGLLWRLRRPAATPTLATLGPALSLLLAPTALAMAADAADRWWYGTSPGTAYQLRVAALFVVGAGLVVVGARQRWLGMVLPAAAALAVVTAVQLVELGRFLPQWVSFAVAGAVLVAAGARWESVRRLGQEGSAWARRLH